MAESRRLAAAWDRFERVVVPKTAGEVQRVETRRAFYAGASVLFEIITSGFDDSPDPSDADMRVMDGLADEIREFGEELDRAVLASKPSAGEA